MSSLLRNFLFDAVQNASFSSLDLFNTYMVFLYEIGNFPDDFILLNEICNFDALKLASFQTICLEQDICYFYQMDILHFPGTSSLPLPFSFKQVNTN